MRKSVFIFALFFSSTIFSQSSLHVQCNQAADFQNGIYTRVELDSQIVEYNYCGWNPSFFITIFDTTCFPWGTDYQSSGGYSLGQVNTGCRPRVEYHFQYFQNSLTNLISLDSLINNLPDNHTFVIYTPLSFDWNEIYDLYPPLALTLLNLWGNAVLEAQMIVASGVKGLLDSYEIDTTLIDQVTYMGVDFENVILFNTIICPHPSSTSLIEENLNSTNFTIFPNPTNSNFTISTPLTEMFSYHIEDIFGREIISCNEFQKEIELDLSDQPSGIYLLVIESETGERTVRRIVKN